MKVRSLLVLSMVLFGLAFSLVAISTITTTQQVNRLNQQLEILGQAEREANELNQISNDFLLNHDTRQQVQWEIKFASFSETLDLLETDNSADQALLGDIRSDRDRLYAVFSDVVAGVHAREASGNPPDLVFIQTSWSRISIQNVGILFEINQLSHSIRSESDRIRQLNTLLVFFLMCITFLILITTFFLITRRVLRSVADLLEGTRVVAAGDLGHRIPEKGDDEFQYLTASFNAMTASRKDAEDDLRREHEELNAAYEQVTATEDELRKKHEELHAAYEQLNAFDEELRQNYNELARNEQVIKESERKFRLLADFTYEWEYWIGTDGKFVYITPSCERVTGYTPEEFIENPLLFQQIIHPDDLPRMLIHIAEQNPSEHSGVEEFRIITKDGLIRWISHSCHPIFDEMETNLGRRATNRDITERKQAEHTLQLANRKLSLMNMVAWHDIQNKVTGLRGYVELSKDMVTGDRMPSFLKTEEDILRVIHQQLAYTKEYQEIGASPQQWMSIAAVVRNAKVMVGTGRIAFTVELADLEIFCDPIIEKVFHHLIDNSVRHGKTVSRISVTYRTSPSGIVIVYEDNGVGIPPESLAGLFTKSFGKTTGFDLFFVHDALEISGLDIVENGEPGKGVRFEITVPRGLFRFTANSG